MAVFGGDAFRVKLYAMQVPGFVLQPHDQAISLRRHLQIGGQGRTVNDKRMIARGVEVLRQTLENTGITMLHLGEFAVHLCGCPDNIAAKRLANRLQPEADAKHRNFSGSRFDEIDDDPLSRSLLKGNL